jgi:hypothetical protein
MPPDFSPRMLTPRCPGLALPPLLWRRGHGRQISLRASTPLLPPAPPPACRDPAPAPVVRLRPPHVPAGQQLPLRVHGATSARRPNAAICPVHGAADYRGLHPPPCPAHSSHYGSCSSICCCAITSSCRCVAAWHSTAPGCLCTLPTCGGHAVARRLRLFCPPAHTQCVLTTPLLRFAACSTMMALLRRFTRQ